MREFIAKYQDEIQGTLSGFDRVVFAGALRNLDFSLWEPGLKLPRAINMERYLAHHHILYKDYADHVKAVSERIKQAALAPFRQEQTAHPASAISHHRQRRRGP